MNIQEQRIGNLVYGIYEDETGKTDKIICRVVAVDETESLGDGWSSIIQRIDDGPEIEEYEDTAPIPLTKEWLKRFGFGGRLHWWTKSNITLGYITTDENFQCELNVQMMVDLKYVHQLQNLYFALTGQQLTLAPPQR